MSELTDFLLARIAEDEAWEAEHPHFGDGTAPDFVPPWWTRVRAECAAKRRIVTDGTDSLGQPLGAWELLTFTRLAAIHADHPDYREEWRP